MKSTHKDVNLAKSICMKHGCKARKRMTCQINTYVQLGKAIKELDRKKQGEEIITTL